MKVITEKQRKDFEKRFEIVESKLPRNYVSVMEFLRPGRYTKVQLRNFKLQRTVNFDILEDFEEIIQLVKN